MMRLPAQMLGKGLFVLLILTLVLGCASLKAREEASSAAIADAQAAIAKAEASGGDPKLINEAKALLYHAQGVRPRCCAESKALRAKALAERALGAPCVSTVYFDFDKATIKSEYKPMLDRLAKTLKGNPDLGLLIEGHTDDQGSDDYNQKLSEARGKAVKNYIMEKGVCGAKLEVKGWGEKRRAARNVSPQARAKNRRVELRLVKQ